MKKSIARKVELVDDLVNKFKMAKTIVMFEYKGLSVFNLTTLRTQLHKENIDLKVYKNNITRRAASIAGFDSLVESLVGPLAVAISYDDVVAPAKIINEFAKTNKTVVITSGVIEEKVADKNAIMELANLPSRETLLTQLAAGLLMPVKELAVGLNMLTEAQE
ncbi:50S ribosomal protein L10 [Acholeplasma granularum]|uniref:50S ribosomal protein L10 n=1 Tax=Acholeplasma granularum TaxID=264635 RepID=UPI000471BF1A|nr:50S ribosomal protein L10 [Acholeplasma granularum]